MEESVNIPLVTVDDDAVVPSYAYEGDAGLDLVSTEDVVLRPFQRALISTGLTMAIPTGYAGFVLPRSGLAIRRGLTLINTPGLIDSRYRGEIKVPAVNLDPEEDIVIGKGDRIAQLVILAVPHVGFIQCETLDTTERSTSGFGSSGIR